MHCSVVPSKKQGQLSQSDIQAKNLSENGVSFFLGEHILYIYIYIHTIYICYIYIYVFFLICFFCFLNPYGTDGLFSANASLNSSFNVNDVLKTTKPEIEDLMTVIDP